MNRRPTSEELCRRITEPFEPQDEFEMMLDREFERTLAMSPEEIRADLEAMGCDVAAIERQAEEFLGRMGWRRPGRGGRGRLYSVAAPIGLLVMLAEAAAPIVESVPPALPMAAAAEPSEPPAAVTAAGAVPESPDEDGGSDDARAR